MAAAFWGSCSDLLADYSRDDMTGRLLESTAVITVPDSGAGEHNDYWLMKLVGRDGTGKPALGIVAVLMNSHGMLGNDPENMDLSLTLLSDSATLTGRQLLYQQNRDQQEGWAVTTLSEETITQFPSYSVKLSVSKMIPWSELDMEILLNSLLIGLGMIMLIIALERSKQKQEQQLLERNAVIEQQVEDQTKELAIARDKALDASRVKSDFLASMSHEIRTPLNAIIGMAELLDETRLTKEQKKYTNVFRKAGDTLLSLVNDILDLSKIEARQLELENIEFNLEVVLEESLDIYALKAAEKKIELICEIDPALKKHRMGDPSRIRQIVLNLISNALKFTDGGEIVVRAEPEPGEDESILRISVRDTGIGIPSSKLQSIFESFSQVDSSTTRKYGGTGLGLAICKSLVEMMGGRIWVESEIKEGSKFIFTANLPVAESAGKQTEAAAPLDGMRFLVVDDNDTGRRNLTEFLESLSGQAYPQETGAAALAALTESSSYDYALLDHPLTDMDTLELAAAVKKCNPRINVLLMLSSVDLNDSIGKEHKTTVDGYLVKPVKRSELLKYVASSGTTVPGEEPARVQSVREAEDSEPLNVLLVDDNDDNRLLVKAFLKKLPYTIDEATDGQEALNKVRGGNYDIVFMDVQMPVMDGRKATRLIREWEKKEDARHTPIIALTAHAIQEEIDECLEAGCDSHVSKPVKKATLLDVIREYTR